MPDSAPIRIPTTYAMPCETFRFAWRNERFVLAVFRLRPGPKRNGPAGRASSPLPARQSKVQVTAKKLRKSALKPLKSLSRVTLCAGRVRSPALFERVQSVRRPGPPGVAARRSPHYTCAAQFSLPQPKGASPWPSSPTSSLALSHPRPSR
jgi:hypothetical protein